MSEIIDLLRQVAKVETHRTHDFYSFPAVIEIIDPSLEMNPLLSQLEVRFVIKATEHEIQAVLLCYEKGRSFITADQFFTSSLREILTSLEGSFVFKELLPGAAASFPLNPDAQFRIRRIV